MLTTKSKPEFRFEIIFSKSVTEILIENNLIHRITFRFSGDPIHLNDIQPVLKDGPYFKKGDLFLSFRNLNMVILYRPETNKVIKNLSYIISKNNGIDNMIKKKKKIFNKNQFIKNKKSKTFKKYKHKPKKIISN